MSGLVTATRLAQDDHDRSGRCVPEHRDGIVAGDHRKWAQLPVELDRALEVGDGDQGGPESPRLGDVVNGHGGSSMGPRGPSATKRSSSDRVSAVVRVRSTAVCSVPEAKKDGVLGSALAVLFRCGGCCPRDNVGPAYVWRAPILVSGSRGMGTFLAS